MVLRTRRAVKEQGGNARAGQARGSCVLRRAVRVLAFRQRLKEWEMPCVRERRASPAEALRGAQTWRD